MRESAIQIAWTKAICLEIINKIRGTKENQCVRSTANERNREQLKMER